MNFSNAVEMDLPSQTASSKSSSDSARLPRRVLVVWIVALLACHTLLLAYTALHKSACADEPAHLAAGLAYWKYHEFSIYNLSPPLARLILTLPAHLFSDADVPPAKSFNDVPARRRPLEYSEAFNRLNLSRLARLVISGRFAAFPFSIGCALLVCHWGRKLFGDVAAIGATAIWCFSPTIIAHGSTLGTDMPITFFVFAATTAWSSFIRRIAERDDRRASITLLLSGLLIGAAIATKFNGILLLPIQVLIAMFEYFRRRSQKNESPLALKTLIAGLVATSIIAFVVVNGTYGYRLLGDPIGRFEFVSDSMLQLQKLLPSSLPVPFPRPMIEGFDAQKLDLQGGVAQSLFGEAYFGNDPRYYPWLLLITSTVGGILLIALFVFTLPKLRFRAGEMPLLCIVLFMGIGMYLTARLNIGIRYFLPVYPPMIVMLCRSLIVPRVRVTAVCACALLAIESCLAAPRYHSFCNWIARPFENNVPQLDWGQSLTDLHDWMRDHHQSRINIVQFTAFPTAAYDIDADESLGELNNEFIAITRNALDGLPMRSSIDGFVFVRGWRKLRDLRPVADLGGLRIFRSADVIKTSPDAGPWIRPALNWSDIINDPALTHIRNADTQGLRQPEATTRQVISND